MDLQDYRARIDETDDRILQLFKKRMDISRQIALYKKENGLPVLDSARERDKLIDIGDKAGDELRSYTFRLFELLFELSRAHQSSVLNTDKNFGLLGEKLVHSFSPLIHGFLGEYSYSLFEIEPGKLESFMIEKRFDGINVTIPYKQSVIPYCADLSEEARITGSVNTIVKSMDGALHGHNTDFYGFNVMLERGGIDPNGKKALVLGDGGAARTVRVVLDRSGAREVVTISRRGENNYGNIERHYDAEIIVNTTPVGMYPNNGGSPISLTGFERLAGVADLIYNPLRTKLLLDAERIGVPFVNGLVMLVAQAEMASRLFLGDSFDITTPALRAIPPRRGMGAVVSGQWSVVSRRESQKGTTPDTTEKYSSIDTIREAILKKTQNIALIGMPGCGKSTVGVTLAQMIERPFADCDDLVVSAAGKTIPEIFTDDGEDAFRRLETRILAEESRKSGIVIATGGGVVTMPENFYLLRQNSIVIYLKRELSELVTDGRPLSGSQGVEALAKKRLSLYEAWSDFAVEVEARPELTAARIIEELGVRS